MEKRYPFNKALVGCHIDGAYGEDHRRAKLVEMLNDCDCVSPKKVREEIKQVQFWLGQESSDDYGEEDLALEIIGAFTAPGLTWELDAGDLFLTTEAK